MFDRNTSEFAVAIMAGLLFVWNSNKEKPFHSRFVMTIVSAGIGFSAARNVANWLALPEAIVALLVTAVGYTVLEVLTAIVADREVLTEAIKKRLGR